MIFLCCFDKSRVKSNFSSENLTRKGQISSKRDLLAPVQIAQWIRFILVAGARKRALVILEYRIFLGESIAFDKIVVWAMTSPRV